MCFTENSTFPVEGTSVNLLVCLFEEARVCMCERERESESTFVTASSVAKNVLSIFSSQHFLPINRKH